MTGFDAVLSTSAWRPASYNGPHTFRINHGGAGGTCETCHPNGYTSYTCYNCHEHNQSEINKKHQEEGAGISPIASSVTQRVIKKRVTNDPTIIPDEEALSSAEIDQLVEKFTVGYLLEALHGPIPAGSCSWPSARESLHNHFSPERQNVAFYFVVDDFGANIWAQWDGPTDPLFMMTSLMNVMMELECFFPTANLIFIVVDSDGTTGLVGVVPQGDAGSMQIVYER